MEYLHNGFTLSLCEGAFPLSTDSIALSGFVRLPRNAKVLDLGSGCGTLGMLLCANDPTCQVTGVEIDEKAHLTALENARVNGITSRLSSICADLRTLHSFLAPGSFQICVSNPPYFPAGQESANSKARHQLHCNTDELFEAAARALQYGGDFFLVHKPDRLAQLCSCASQAGLEPKRLRIVTHRPGGQPAMILLQCRKGAAPGLIWEQMSLFHADGSPTSSYKKIYHL
jgi:tRNA1(Val) A37 N6-methylase TrmN6